jgi:hypothetical protein
MDQTHDRHLRSKEARSREPKPKFRPDPSVHEHGPAVAF